MANNLKSVNVIIVTYNGEDFIEKCINSLLCQNYAQEYFITVIDNASRDNTVNIIKKYPKINLILNKKNVGFARANNIAFKNYPAEYIILLNQDSVVETKFIRQMVGIMTEDSKIGICGSAEHPYDKTLKSNRTREETDWVGCGATICRAAALNEIGFFDDNYFLYNEDIDLCASLSCAGWKVYYLPEAIWHHHGWGRTVEITNFRILHSSVSRIYLLIKFASLGQMCDSFSRYIFKKQNISGVRGNDEIKNIKINKIKNKTKCILIIGILARALPKVPFALLNRFKVRKLKNFNQLRVDELIKTTDVAIYK